MDEQIDRAGRKVNELFPIPAFNLQSQRLVHIEKQGQCFMRVSRDSRILPAQHRQFASGKFAGITSQIFRAAIEAKVGLFGYPGDFENRFFREAAMDEIIHHP